MRIAHYIAQTGYCSRRAAARLIREGRVTLDGALAKHVDQLTLNQTTQQTASLICIDGQALGAIADKVYWLLNKAVGTDCRLRPEDPSSLIHLLPKQPRLYPVGRLDKDSHGLLLLTNDGELAQRLMHPSFAHHKRYHVELDKPFNEYFLARMAAGVSYKKVTTLPCQVSRLSDRRFEIVLTQGLNRQIRRMSQALGYRVIDLKRIAIQSLQLGDLASGEMRPLTAQEIQDLMASLKA
ncbi:23S rRNA pseudouridine(2604) synthase RluF [Shewanella sp. AS1]|uniref:23S rRNA pseudouridine(2604) synthase RluF n=1 Tax=Shewanella sp. AS1 TaxID=2907626 RepID=UPI001F1874E5|nr:23S rRNA pseudouridine(2604) synthase RluF [Shewanella sp. AS1]MCE9679314.1 23S rRNA pseudouridine(2604) synthase RluF [Shewanella sp. AS1]